MFENINISYNIPNTFNYNKHNKIYCKTLLNRINTTSRKFRLEQVVAE